MSSATRLVAHERLVRQRRGTTVALVLAVLLFVAVCAAVMFGDVVIPVRDVVPGLFGHGERATVFILQTLRLPRVLAALLVGAALAVSGSIFQTMTRNPLASPDIIGITPSASAAAAFAILILRAQGTVVALFALGGATLGAIAIYALSWRRGSHGYRLVLVGIGVAAFSVATTSWLLTQRGANEAQHALIWITGSLNEVSTTQVAVLAAVVAACAVVLPVASRWLGVMELGDEAAAALGLRTEVVRAATVLLAVLLAGAAVAVAGPVPFIALVSAPIARQLARRPGLVPLTAGLVGAALLLGSDEVAQRLLDNQPVGVVSGVIGAPYLIWLLTRVRVLGTRG